MWGEDRIAQEMKLKLGIEHSASTIRRDMITEGRSPSSTWRSFLRNPASEIYALDLTPQVMWDFSIGYVWVSEAHLRRTLMEFRGFYNTARPHQGIGAIPAELDEPRVPLVLQEGRRLVGEPVLGGLHPDYRLAA